MERWKEEALFALDYLKKDEEVLFRDDDSEHTLRKQRDEFVKQWGFSTDEMWDLDAAIAAFILPRIAYYAENHETCPGVLCEFGNKNSSEVTNSDSAAKKWKEILETIRDGFHLYLSKDILSYTEEDKLLWKKAKGYFFEYFEYLWE